MVEAAESEEVVSRPRLWREWSQSLAARWWLSPVLAFVVTRLGVAAVAYLAVRLIAAQPETLYHLRPPELNILVDAFGSRWDTGFYVNIAEEGYKYWGSRLPSVAFFPLYPLMMRALIPLVGDALVAGILISNAALLLAALVFYRLVADEWGAAVAGRAVWYLLIFPTSFFGSAVYTESLFLLTMIGALYLARRGFWESAAMVGVAASLTKLLGLLAAPMLLAEWWMQRRARPAEERPPLWALLAPAAVPLGTLAYMVYLQVAFSDPLAFVQAAEAWEREPLSPLVMVGELLQRPGDSWLGPIRAGTLPLDNWMDATAIFTFLVLGCLLLVRRRWSEGVLVVLGSLIPLSSGLWNSHRRYVWVLFPVFILLARWGERPWLDRLITAVFLMGLALFTAMFANALWVA